MKQLSAMRSKSPAVVAEEAKEEKQPQQHEPHHWEVANRDLLVLPSMSFPPKLQALIPGGVLYEQRLLYVLFGLAAPRTRLTIVTSIDIDESILNYYYWILSNNAPQTNATSFQRRVKFFHCDDSDAQRNLAKKLLDRPPLLQQIKEELHGNATKIPYMKVVRGTADEATLAQALEVPYFAAKSEKDFQWDRKDGNRKLFRDLNIPCPDGTYEATKDLQELITGIITVVERNPHVRKGIVKLVDSANGFGCGIMDMCMVQEYSNSIRQSAGACTGKDWTEDKKLRQLVEESLVSMALCPKSRTIQSFLEEVKEMGAIFEIFIEPIAVDERMEMTSPSVQAVINEDGTVAVLSTHEQILNGQVYAGCEFPCKQSYRLRLMSYARQMGVHLASKGVTGHFGADFLCVPRSCEDGTTEEDYDIYAIEINLRMTGTTYPFMTLKLLTNGSMDETTGLFYSLASWDSPYLEEHEEEEKMDEGLHYQPTCKYYVSSQAEDPALKRLNAISLLELMQARPDLHWQGGERETGVVFQMLGGLPDLGKVGITAISNSREEACALLHRTIDYIIAEAKNR